MVSEEAEGARVEGGGEESGEEFGAGGGHCWGFGALKGDERV